jgi:chloramphenicol 3-O phosphotransferase
MRIVIVRNVAHSNVNGNIIFINGTSSAGKSTLCKVLREALPEPFWYMASDQFIEVGMAPSRRDQGGRFDWGELRPHFFDGFHKVLPAFASAGNHLLVEHIVEFQDWMDDLVQLLHGFDVFFVGLQCPADVLEQRERDRGNRQIGEARYHLKTHNYCSYDLEVDCQHNLQDNVNLILNAWRQRSAPSAFEKMYQKVVEAS